jgi:osmotically-inducible protein OsmY
MLHGMGMTSLVAGACRDVRATIRRTGFVPEADMRSDMDLQKDVAAELKWEPRLREDEIGVTVRDGVVTLTGFVPDYAQRRVAAKAAERVVGVRAVAQELVVKVPEAAQRSDTELAHQVVNALAWDIEVPDGKIKARVENGWVTLEGEVDWQYQRGSAERAVRYLTGVRGVNNMVTIKPHASPYDVAQHIKAALHRTAEADAKKIQVTASDGKVTLTGTVRSWPERADIERAAWSASGVTAVDDRLAVIL